MFTKSTLFRNLALIVFLLLFSGMNQLRAQALGDIAFTGYNSQPSGGSNEFSFVVLKAGGFASGTQILFTDKGWDRNASAFYSAEGYFTWTSGTLAQFAEVRIQINTAGSAASIVSNGSCSAVTGTFILSASQGDQLFAFTGSIASPTFIAGLHANNIATVGGSGQPVSTAAGWDPIAATAGPSGWTITSEKSAIPSTLTNGTNAVMLVDVPGAGGGAPLHNFRFKCSKATAGSLSALRTQLNDVANWDKQNTTAYTLPTGCTYGLATAATITGQPSNSAVCAGANTSFTVTASNATSYQWRVNTGSGYINVTDAGVYSNSTTATLNLTGVTAGMNGYKYKVAAISSGGSDTSSEVTLTVSSPGTWLGTASTAWSNTANWSCATIPTSSTNVTIPSGTTYSPLIDSTNVVANNLTISPGATLGFSTTTKIISIAGVLTNNGIFNTTGRVAFTGTSQTIPVMTYAKLQVTGGGSKSLAGATTITDSLIFTNGYILLGNFNLTLSGTGRIGGGTSTASYCVVNGTGGLVQQNLGSGGRTGTINFPLGLSTTSFTPLRINNLGTADAFTGRVINHVYDGYTNDVPTGPQITSNVVDRTWTLTEAVAGGSNATVTVQWNGVDELPTFDNFNCVLSHYTGGDWTNNGRPFSTAGGFDPYTLSRSAITSFSPFGVGGPSSPLPVKLIGFEGAYASGKVNLNWTVAQESGIHQYGVERSNNGSDFKQIGESVPARNRDMEYKYSFTDAPVAANTTLYYRLHIINQDGTSRYSQVVKINTGNRADYGVVLVNNPVKENVELKVTSFEAETAFVRITDIAGRTVASKSFAVANGTQTISMPVNTLAGNKFYLVKVTIGNQSYEYKVLIN